MADCRSNNTSLLILFSEYIFFCFGDYLFFSRSGTGIRVSDFDRGSLLMNRFDKCFQLANILGVWKCCNIWYYAANRSHGLRSSWKLEPVSIYLYIFCVCVSGWVSITTKNGAWIWTESIGIWITWEDYSRFQIVKKTRFAKKAVLNTLYSVAFNYDFSHSMFDSVF